MKKLLTLFAGVLMLAACQDKTPSTFKGFEYQLIGAPNDVKVTLSFDADENRYFGKVVNNFFGTYIMEDDKISFGPAGATMMMGTPDKMEAESYLFKSLPMVRKFKLAGNKLILTTEDGKILEFKQIGEAKKK